MAPKRRLKEKTPCDSLNPYMPSSLSEGCVAEGLGVSLHTYKITRKIGMPIMLYTIMSSLTRLVEFPTDTIECIEYVSGVGNIKTKFHNAGFPALGYDIEYDLDNNDLCSTQGFIFALVCMMRLAPDGLAWFATVCSSWIWLASNSTRRTRANPLGRNDSESVRHGNVQVARSAVLMALCHAKAAWWGLEQPLKSLMAQHPAMAWVAKQIDWVEVSTVMGAFGACTLTPSSLFGNSGWLRGLHRTRPKKFIPANNETVIYEVVSGKKRVCGSKGLKRTQEYTTKFADKVLECFLKFRGQHTENIESSDDEATPANEEFDTAGFQEVLKDMHTP